MCCGGVFGSNDGMTATRAWQRQLVAQLLALLLENRTEHRLALRGPTRRWSMSRLAGIKADSLVETMGLEPTTPCLQSRCSSQLSYVPRAC